MPISFYHFITNSTDYLVIGYRTGRIYHDSTEDLIEYVAVKMCHQLPIGKANVGSMP